eukprot:626786-Rhodomonas_salina.1
MVLRAYARATHCILLKYSAWLSPRYRHVMASRNAIVGKLLRDREKHAKRTADTRFEQRQTPRARSIRAYVCARMAFARGYTRNSPHVETESRSTEREREGGGRESESG